MIGDKTLRRLKDVLEDNLKKELRAQGHFLTGALEKSIRTQFSSTFNNTVLQTVALDYIDDLEEGIRPEHINPEDPKYLKGLTSYVQKRFGFDAGKAAAVALRIAHKHRKEGMPTKASYEFSTTGERTFAILDSYNKNEARFNQILGIHLSKEIDAHIDKIFQKEVY